MTTGCIHPNKWGIRERKGIRSVSHFSWMQSGMTPPHKCSSFSSSSLMKKRRIIRIWEAWMRNFDAETKKHSHDECDARKEMRERDKAFDFHFLMQINGWSISTWDQLERENWRSILSKTLLLLSCIFNSSCSYSWDDCLLCVLFFPFVSVVVYFVPSQDMNA